MYVRMTTAAVAGIHQLYWILLYHQTYKPSLSFRQLKTFPAFTHSPHLKQKSC